MDELDKLKNAWKKDENAYPQFSEKDIYAMLHKKSSSIVKWILIISIIEFAFWLLLSLVLKEPGTKNINLHDLEYVTVPMTVVNYGIILYFMYVFYMRYKKISATDSVKELMQNILKTRKAVSLYIYVMIAYAVISTIIIVLVMFNTNTAMIDLLHKLDANGQKMTFYLFMIFFCVASLSILALLIWLFYKLVYGLLVKRLYKNYEELKKIDL
ncbi:hypothetical protein GR160_03725 [Flavobacterium sp. Sd200]|uniref:hypothetical protein n=1 Tax=Flavobacterium sp. Sd200 TaxID=2692211 RepID=UPI00136F0D31|nr:hypothetical protein [Flavobacterium sp. Sd200]MXN90324.1 hypothetical protein [Flavobacterium sp. Sd200]